MLDKDYIKQRLIEFMDGRDELYKLAEKQEWKTWLASPDAWLQFMLSNFTVDEQKQISEVVLTDNTRIYNTIYECIMYVHNNPDYIKGFKSLKEMVDLCGPIDA